ncbi:archaetidylserine decarboxylase [Roseateles sp. DAIF2]|uniref:archaetidylserine decarboxylase n=1 Tax=Roseateles sp. DAIF2 TaxID=2714952 RepID=UPI00201DD266|nr:archaetidylserine decarboxylase [Roseateles sp. DAIF2]
MKRAAMLMRDRLLQQEDLNFLLTNRIPRLALTRLVGWYSRIESPLLARFSIAVWRLFTRLDLGEAKRQRFSSLQDCFTRELKEGARPLASEPGALLSPCDAIVGACGAVERGQVFQAKGFPYSVGELFGDAARAAPFLGGQFVTLRLTSAMYHRFHAPADLTIEHVTHIAGDTWNVNPIALKRVERLFCRNERAAIHARLAEDGRPIALVAVAAILVASLRLHCLDLLLHVDYPGPHELPVDASAQKGQELGWFQQGSTIIVFLPPGFALAVASGQHIRMGEVLARA